MQRHGLRLQYVLIALVCLAASGWLVWEWVSFEGLPSRDRLARLSGELLEVGRARRAVRWRIAGAQAWFEYPARHGELEQVRQALERASGSRASVLIDAGAATDVARNPDRVVPAYELTLDGEAIRSHAQIEAAWRGHHAWGAAFGVLLLFAAVAALVRALRPAAR